MDGHFRAFTFVDRITLVEPGVRIRGAYAIPRPLDSFPISLVAEAIGQLAAWASMAAVDFTHRPLAGIAGAVEILSAVRPGQALELAAELESADAESVVYGGMALADGTPVVRLVDCVGPMVPLPEYDDPEAVREHFSLLCGPGAVPGGFSGLPSLPLEEARLEPGRCFQAILPVPDTASFFADHFPRRPVFPGTLVMNAQLDMASAVAGGLLPAEPGSRWAPRTVSKSKLRGFTSPGEILELEAKLAERFDDSLRFDVQARRAGKMLGGAQMLFASQKLP